MRKKKQGSQITLKVCFFMALLRRFVVCSVAVGICGVDVCGVVKLLHPPHSQKKGHFPRRLEKKKRGDKNLGKEMRRDRDW